MCAVCKKSLKIVHYCSRENRLNDKKYAIVSHHFVEKNGKWMRPATTTYL